MSDVWDRLQELAQPGRPLGPGGRDGTVRDPRRFPSTQRRQLHQRLLAAWADSFADGACDRQALVLAGPPGLRESPWEEALIEATGIPTPQWFFVGSEDFEDQLARDMLSDEAFEQFAPPELQAFERLLRPLDLAPLVREEAAGLTDEAIRSSVALGRNLVIDGTLSQPAPAEALLMRLEEADYTVRIVVVDAELEIVETRVHERWRQGREADGHGTGDAQPGGPLVPLCALPGLYALDGASICLAMARDLAERHGCVTEYTAYRVYAADGAPQPLDHRGRSAKGGILLDHEAYSAVAAGLPPVIRERRSHAPTSPARPAARRGGPRREPQRGAGRG